MPILHLPGEMMPGTIGPDQPRLLGLQELPDLDHVHRRNAFGDADDQRNVGVGGFHDGVGRDRRRNKDHGGVGAGLFDRFAHGVEDGPAFVRGAAFAGRDAADDLRAVRGGVLGVECAFAAGEALHQQVVLFINKDAHRTPLAAATTFSAASFMVSATMNFSPLFSGSRGPARRWCLPAAARSATGCWSSAPR